jgi:hypothetical protein
LLYGGDKHDVSSSGSHRLSARSCRPWSYSEGGCKTGRKAQFGARKGQFGARKGQFGARKAQFGARKARKSLRSAHVSALARTETGLARTSGLSNVQFPAKS